MRKEKFVYNEQTLQFEVHREPVKVKALRIFSFFLATLVVAGGLATAVYKYFPSQSEQNLQRKIVAMETRFRSLDSEVETMAMVLGNVQARDASAHRMVFGMEPIDPDVWTSGTGGHDRLVARGSTEELIASSEAQAERLKRQLVLQSKSLDTILALAKDREEMLASIPSIKPIRQDQYKRNIKLLSGFGMRIHPIYKRRKLHAGIDFPATANTPIQATGNGRVRAVKKQRSGYGTHVIIDHGFGYETLYGHMSKVEVKKGQQVKRGQVIGRVGSTGTSTAPHLHYEVHLKGQKVDPIHYCMDGLTPEEYQEMVNDAATANQSFD